MTCSRGPTGRVVTRRHTTPCGSPGVCLGCLPCPEPHCLVCDREHSETTCPTCMARTRAHLSGVVVLSDRLGDEAVAGQRSARGTLLGGDALVLLAPAATDHGWLGQFVHRLTSGLDVSHVQDESRADPTPPLAVLLAWEDRWRSILNQPTDLAPTLSRSAAYLGEHLHEAAREPAFVDFAQAIARLLLHLEDVLTDGVRPERSRVPCWDCGTRLMKVYADRIADDHWVCPRCREVYDKGRFDRAKHDHLASEGAERFVYIADAAAAVGRPEQTVRAWVRRRIVNTSRDQHGRLVAWWPDVREAHRIAVERRRKVTP